MHRFRIFFCIILIALALSACGKRLTIQDAQEAGAPELSGGEISRLITGSTLHFVSWDKADEADILFFTDGSLEGQNRWGETSTGRWKIDDDGKLCVKYQKWGSGFMSCYSVFRMDDTYRMFRVDGGLDTSFTVVSQGEEAGRPQASAPPEAVVEPAPRKQEKSWLGSLWPWGSDETAPRAPGAVPALEVYTPPEALAPPPLSADMRHLLDDNKCPECNLAGENLAGVKLKGADLQGANLAGANLFQTNLAHADLKGADLSGANLELADLEDADLSGANLSGARLVDAVLEDATLAGANLENANLHWADAREADLKNARLKGAYLVKTNFTDADLTGADLSDTVIQRTIFEDTKGYAPPDQKPAEEGGGRVLEPVPGADRKWWWPF